MLMLNPVEGAIVLKTVGMFLEGGRRGSAPSAHALLHKPRRAKVGKEPSATQEPQVTRELTAYRISPSEIIWSKKLKQSQKKLSSMCDGNGSSSGGGGGVVEKKPTNKSQPKMIENLKKKTHFTRQEIESLCKIYKELLSTSANVVSKSSAVPTPGMPIVANRVEGLDRVVFRELVHNAFDLVTEEVLIDRIFCAFDRNNDGVIKLDNWICGLSTFLRGTLEERAAFCFLVYDMNADGYITRDEMMHLLRNCLMKSPQDEDPEEGVRDLVELALRKIDIDKDGKISYQDFLEAVTAEPLLLEAFGQCLPTETACQTFMSTLRCEKV